MKCPYCSAWSEVQETRGVRRRRICANQHRFTTMETLASKKAKGKGGNLKDRDQQILAQVKEGRSPENVAASFGLSHRRVNQIIKNMDPEFDAHAAGHARAWEKRRIA